MYLLALLAMQKIKKIKLHSFELVYLQAIKWDEKFVLINMLDSLHPMYEFVILRNFYTLHEGL